MPGPDRASLFILCPLFLSPGHQNQQFGVRRPEFTQFGHGLPPSGVRTHDAAVSGVATVPKTGPEGSFLAGFDTTVPVLGTEATKKRLSAIQQRVFFIAKRPYFRKSLNRYPSWRRMWERSVGLKLSSWRRAPYQSTWPVVASKIREYMALAWALLELP